MFNPSVFSMADAIPFLEKLNRFDWYQSSGNQIGVKMNAIRQAVQACETKAARASGELIAVVLLSAMSAEQTSMAKIIRLLSHMVAHGPKLFRPTVELCEMFEHIEINLNMADYAQSYPVMAVQLPQEYMASREITFPYVACMFESEQRHLTTLASNLFDFPINSTTITPAESTIEATLADVRFFGERIDWDARLESVRLAERVAINANLFLADRDFRLQHMLGRDHRARRAARASRSNLLLRPPREIVLTQNVAVSVHTGAGKPVENARTSNVLHSKRTHWRRGHWRMQAHGEARLLRKRIFIAPIIINARFDGVTSQSERRVIYRARPDRRHAQD